MEQVLLLPSFLEKCKQFYHDLVGVLGGQLQIEVDRGKSANRSDPAIINACSPIIKSFDVAPDPANPELYKRWLVVEGKKLGVFRSESAQLPIGTSFEAEIISPHSASVIIISSQGNQLKVGQLKKYAFADLE